METSPIVYQDIVVDITAASCNGSDFDLAAVSATTLFAAAPNADSLASLGDATRVGERLVASRSLLRIEPDGDVFTLRMNVPTAGAGELIKNGAYSLTVLLPRDSVYEGEPIYEIELRDYTKEPVPRVFGVFDLPSIGNRIGIAWSARVDPESVVDYVYRKITGGY